MGVDMDYAANLAFCLLERTGSIFGRIAIRLTAAEQRELFGRYLGKGRIVIDGSQETIANRVQIAFGADYEDRSTTAWSAL